MTRDRIRIEKISVDSLFGHLDYTIRFGEGPSEDGDFSFLYAKNGGGKTTILRLLFSTLCRLWAPGVRSYIAMVPFSHFSVSLSNGHVITLDRPKGELYGSYSVIFGESSAQDVISVDVSPERKVFRDENRAFAEYLSYLDELDFDLVFIADDRRIHSTMDVLSPRYHTRRGHGGILEAGRSIDFTQYYPQALRNEAYEEQNRMDLRPVVRATMDWLRRSAVDRAGESELNANKIYSTVLSTLSNPRAKKDNPELIRHTIVEKLDSIRLVMENFSSFELVKDVPLDDFEKAIDSSQADNLFLIDQVLSPYLDTILSRFSSLHYLYSHLQAYRDGINQLFAHKYINIGVNSGINIRSDHADIGFDSLSSGERQVFILLSSVLMATSKNCIFILDEPEISLNIEWQRSLFDILSEVSFAAPIQFLTATHSIEILSGREDQISELKF